MSGVGLTQEADKPIQEIHPGDVIECPPDIQHWHGAAPKTAMTHLAVTGVVNGKSVEWMEKVNNEEYNARRSSSGEPRNSRACLWGGAFLSPRPAERLGGA